MNNHDPEPWKKLSRSLRERKKAVLPLPETPPYGFHTRVLARIRPGAGLTPEVLFRLAMRALPLGLTVLLACWLLAPLATEPPTTADPDLAELLLEVALP